MFLTKSSLPRRSFLRGLGATLALPLLDAMTPAFAATRKAIPETWFHVHPERRQLGAVDTHRIRDRTSHSRRH